LLLFQAAIKHIGVARNLLGAWQPRRRRRRDGDTDGVDRGKGIGRGCASLPPTRESGGAS